MAGMTAAHNQVSLGNTIQYALVTYNGGGHFDGSSSTFTCPVTGVYLFSIQLMDTYGDTDIDITLYKDNEGILTTSTADSKYPTSEYETGHALTIVHCEQNEKLNVRSTFLSGTSVPYFGQWNTKFAGGLLYGSVNTNSQVHYFSQNERFQNNPH